MTNQERKGLWVFLNLDRWPIVGSLVGRDRDGFLKEQAKGKGQKKENQKQIRAITKKDNHDF